MKPTCFRMNVHVLSLIAILTIQVGNGLPQTQQAVVQQVGPHQGGLSQLILDLLKYKIRWLNLIRGTATGHPLATFLSGVAPQVTPTAVNPMQVSAHSQHSQNKTGLGAEHPQPYQSHASPQVYYGPQGYSQQAYQSALLQEPQGYSQQNYQTYSQTSQQVHQIYPQPSMNQYQSQTPVVEHPLQEKYPYLHSRPVARPYAGDIDESKVDLSNYHTEPHLPPKPAVQQVLFQPTPLGVLNISQPSSLSAQSTSFASQPHDQSQSPLTPSFSSVPLTPDNPQKLTSLHIPSPALQQFPVATSQTPLPIFHTPQPVSQTPRLDQVAPAVQSLQPANLKPGEAEFSTVAQPMATPSDSIGTLSLSTGNFEDYRK